MEAPFISLIVPVFNEELTIDHFLSRTTGVLDGISQHWEVIFIDDGSSDQTADIIAHKHRDDPRIKLIMLSRNFGKEPALTAGLDVARGKVVIPMDVDLQDPPELIIEMVAKWREGYQVVLATRESRQEDTPIKRLTAGWFYRLIGKISDTPIPANTGDFRLMDAAVVEAIRHMPERTRFMKGIFAWVGFRTTKVFYNRPERSKGESKFRFGNLWKLALDGIFSFTTLPLRIWTYAGALISCFAFIYASFLILRTLTMGADVPGYASMMTVILFLGGIQLVSLGIIGEYVGRIYQETKRRPLYLVQKQLGLPDPERTD